MIWFFEGRLTEKRLLPTPVSYHFEATDWSKHNVSALIGGSRVSVTITSRTQALNIWKESATTEKLSEVFKMLLVSAFAQYWHDQGGNDHCLGVTIGLGDEEFDLVRPDLDLALGNGANVRIGASAGFSAIEQNSQSCQPTIDEFEASNKLILKEISIVLNGS